MNHEHECQYRIEYLQSLKSTLYQVDKKLNHRFYLLLFIILLFELISFKLIDKLPILELELEDAYRYRPFLLVVMMYSHFSFHVYKSRFSFLRDFYYCYCKKHKIPFSFKEILYTFPPNTMSTYIHASYANDGSIRPLSKIISKSSYMITFGSLQLYVFMNIFRLLVAQKCLNINIWLFDVDCGIDRT